jgi:hypothetical protein
LFQALEKELSYKITQLNRDGDLPSLFIYVAVAAGQDSGRTENSPCNAMAQPWFRKTIYIQEIKKPTL